MHLCSRHGRGLGRPAVRDARPRGRRSSQRAGRLSSSAGRQKKRWRSSRRVVEAMWIRRRRIGARRTRLRVDDEWQFRSRLQQQVHERTHSGTYRWGIISVNEASVPLSPLRSRRQGRGKLAAAKVLRPSDMRSRLDLRLESQQAPIRASCSKQPKPTAQRGPNRTLLGASSPEGGNCLYGLARRDQRRTFLLNRECALLGA